MRDTGRENRNWVSRPDESMVAKAGGDSTMELDAEEAMETETINLSYEDITLQPGDDDHLLTGEQVQDSGDRA